jgi:putative polyhydroxyalkanoate system protein
MEITRKHDKTQEEIRAQLQQIAEHMGRDLGVRYEWANQDLLTFKGTGISGQIMLNEAAKQLEIKLKKGFFVPLSDKAILGKVNAYLDESL